MRICYTEKVDNYYIMKGNKYPLITKSKENVFQGLDCVTQAKQDREINKLTVYFQINLLSYCVQIQTLSVKHVFYSITVQKSNNGRSN